MTGTPKRDIDARDMEVKKNEDGHHHRHGGKQCRETLTQMSDYMDSGMDPKKAKSLEEHFANCKACLAVMKTLRKTIELFRKKPAQKMPAGVARELHAAIGEKIRGKRKP